MTNAIKATAIPDQSAGQVTSPTRATVLARTELAPDIVELTLKPDRPARAIPPGSHVDVTVQLPNGPETRSYSLVDLGHQDGHYRIAVRRDPTGRGGSQWMHTLQSGSTLAVSSPINAFSPTPGRLPSVLLAGGIGITPIVGLARAIRDVGADYRIIYTGRARERMAYIDHLVHEHPDRVLIVESDRESLLDPDHVVSTVPDGGVLYVCGPISLLNSTRAAWERAGRRAEGLRFETFGTSGTLPTGSFRVHVPSRGIDVDVPAASSLLTALEEVGVEIMYDCLRGECGLCRVKVLGASGQIDHRDVFLSERQRAEQRVLCACVSRVKGSSITIEC